MKIYLDIQDFTSPSTVLAAIRSYVSINGNIEIFIKADGYEYTELDDYKNIRRRNKFDQSDLKYVNFNLKTYDEFKLENFINKGTFFRIIDDTLTNEKRIYLFYDKDYDPETIKSKIDSCIAFHQKYISTDQTKNINVGLIEKFNAKNDQIYKYIQENTPSYNNIIPLKDCINNKMDIVLMDNELSFYVFPLLSQYSKFKKKEKSVKSYFASFKPFSYHKMVEYDVDLESLFTFSSYEIETDGKINIYLSKNITPSELFSFFMFLQKLNKVDLD